eukprot:6201014-Pleurochrysis_carterae.AAC.2
MRMTMPLVVGADLHGTASDDPTDLRFKRPYGASSTGLDSSPIRTTHTAHGQTVQTYWADNVLFCRRYRCCVAKIQSIRQLPQVSRLLSFVSL